MPSDLDKHPYPRSAPMDRLSTLLRSQPLWLLLAISSGTCAAFNGVFAKLTTTSLTTTWSTALSSILHLTSPTALNILDLLLRSAFFGLNLLFNAAMWALFTMALTRASSTTRVSIINVSANFIVTALLGLIIFGERLPPMWWAGAGLLAVGNVVIGRREEGDKIKEAGGEREEEVDLLGVQEEEEGEGDLLELRDDLGGEERSRMAVKRGEDVDEPIGDHKTQD